MAACPALSPLPYSRRPIALTQRRVEANRRNARRSTGPRTLEGKARVAGNAIKHGFFAAQERWTPGQHRDFEAMLAGLRDEFAPRSGFEESCVHVMAESYVRMAAVLRYENIAALRDHRRVDRDLDARIAAADPAEAARLRAQRSRLRGAGLWKPTIPGEREAKAICRYLGRLDRTISRSRGAIEKRKNKPTLCPELRCFCGGGRRFNPRCRTSSHQAVTVLASQPSREPRRPASLASERSDRGRDAKTKPLLGIAEKWPRGFARGLRAAIR